MDKTNTPLPDAEPLELTITEVAYRGAGLARVDGWVVFVPGTLPGERVRARILRRRKQYGEARVVEVLEASPQRCAPACPLTGTCPGCSYQAMQYAEEVRLKQAQLLQFLSHALPADDARLLPPLASPQALGYRNKIVLHGDVVEGRPVLGYFSEDNTSILDIPACPLAHPAINAQLATLRADPAFMQSIRPRLGLTLRHTAADGVVYWTGKADPAAAPLRETSALGSLTVPRGGFYQVNPGAADLLLATVRAWMAEAKPEVVVDLYCGVGVFALAAAVDGVATVLGVDSDADAIAAARTNAAALGATACAFMTAPAQDSLRRVLGPIDSATSLAIVDPPRTGLPPRLIRDLARFRPATLIYISCAADTLARDLKLLGPVGYHAQRVQLVDMFPRTPYFETAVLLRRGG